MMVLRIDIQKVLDWANYIYRNRGKKLLSRIQNSLDRDPSSGNLAPEDRDAFISLLDQRGLESAIDSSALSRLSAALTSSQQLSEAEVDAIRHGLRSIKGYFRTLSTYSDELSAEIHDYQRRIPEYWREEIRGISDDILLAAASLARQNITTTERAVLEFVDRQRFAYNITSIAHALQRGNEHGFSVSNVWRIVDLLESRGWIETVGGTRRGAKDRLCFPSLANPFSRRLRDAKEGIISGIVDRDLKLMLDYTKATNFGVRVFEFNSDLYPSVYVISPYELEIGDRVRTVGLFYEHGLEEQLSTNFGISIRATSESLWKEDALVAYVHYREDELLWQDEAVERARRFT